MQKISLTNVLSIKIGEKYYESKMPYDPGYSIISRKEPNKCGFMPGVQAGRIALHPSSRNMALTLLLPERARKWAEPRLCRQAAGLEPRVEMNPILLKPTTDKSLR